MAAFSLKRTFSMGFALGLPLAVVVYVLINLLGKIEKVVGPLAKRMNIDTILGELTISVLAILVLLVLILLLGLLAQINSVEKMGKDLQELILRIFPPLNHLKLMASERLDLDMANTEWKPVLVEKGGTFSPAFIIEETPEWITLVYTKFPTTEPGGLLITKADSIKYEEITMKDMRRFNRQFGKGYISHILHDDSKKI